MSTPLRSRLAVGTVRHRRHLPRPHRFRYGVHHAVIDLDELARLDRRIVGFGHNRAAVTSFHDTDHLGPADVPVKTKLRHWLARHGVDLPDGPVLLHTNLRVLGHVFNPVSWFLCHDEDGTLQIVVAEVNNTFGDSYAYLLDDLERVGDTHRAQHPKRFHVSPFMDIPDHHYRFTFRWDGERFVAHMDVDGPEGRLFDATVAERLAPFTSRRLWTLMIRHPLLPLWTLAAIHYQAVRLWWKRTPVFPRPAPPDPGFDRPGSDGRSAPRSGDRPRPADASRADVCPPTLEQVT